MDNSKDHCIAVADIYQPVWNLSFADWDHSLGSSSSVQPGSHGSPPYMSYLNVPSGVTPAALSSLFSILAYCDAGSAIIMQTMSGLTWICSTSYAAATSRDMSSIMGDLEIWMSSNRLRCNSVKRIIHLAGYTRQHLRLLDTTVFAATFPISAAALQYVTMASPWRWYSLAHFCSPCQIP